MKKHILLPILLTAISLCLVSCAGLSLHDDSNFSIQFIDVGQGDSALIECDGHAMLIDGGKETRSVRDNRVYQVLESKGIQRLDYLVISHLHEDHYGGLIQAVKYASEIDRTLCNKTYADADSFRNLEHELHINGTQITVPHVGEQFKLGSAEVEVIDASADGDNDSLVLMLTYGETRFLFTGDIEGEIQSKIADKFQNEKDEAYKVDLIKMPHHGSYKSESSNGTSSLYRFIRTFMPDYAVISVGADNQYGHPDPRTLDILDDAGVRTYRTDLCGDITVISDGTNLSVEASK